MVNKYAFYVDPDSFGTNAFSYNWKHEFFYSVSPFPFSKCPEKDWKWKDWKKILIVSTFTTSFIYKIVEGISEWPLTLLKSSKRELYFPPKRKSIPQMPDEKFMACHLSGNHSETRKYWMKLQKCSCNHGERKLNNVLTTSLLYVQYFVINGRLFICNQQ